MNGIDPVFSLWRARKTLLEILRLRGYDIPDEDFVSFEDAKTEWEDKSIEEIKKEFERVVRGGKIDILINWAPIGKIGRDTIINLTEKMKEEGVTKALLITNGKISTYANSVISSLKIQKIYIEIFTEKELQVNVTENVNVPEHVVCSDDTKRDVLAKYSIKAEQCPRILSSDVMVKYIGASKGQLIRIKRPCETMPEIDGEKKYYYSYRIVV